VIGGLIALSQVIARSRAGAYDHEHHDGMRLAGMYWHFLNIIWIVMFAVLLATTR
jgi:cytochrome c oxidase subunit 3